jgi:hypothetical protein
LPENGFLLGTLAGTRAQTYALPDTTLRINGTLTLYSLAHQEIVGTAALSTRQP